MKRAGRICLLRTPSNQPFLGRSLIQLYRLNWRQGDLCQNLIWLECGVGIRRGGYLVIIPGNRTAMPRGQETNVAGEYPEGTQLKPMNRANSNERLATIRTVPDYRSYLRASIGGNRLYGYDDSVKRWPCIRCWDLRDGRNGCRTFRNGHRDRQLFTARPPIIRVVSSR